MSHKESKSFTRRSSEDRVSERSWTPVRANSTASDLVKYDNINTQSMLHKAKTEFASTSTLQDEEEQRVNDLLAQLNSAMNIDPEASTSNDFSSDVLDNFSIGSSEQDYPIDEYKKKKNQKVPSEMSSTDTLHEDSDRTTRRLDSMESSSQASTSQDLSAQALPPSKLIEERPVPVGTKKKVKKMTKSETEKMQLERYMWNASDTTVLEHLLNNKGNVTKWQAVATARGLCSLSNNCRCPDCRASYMTFDNDGSGGMTDMPMAAPACVVQ